MVGRKGYRKRKEDKDKDPFDKDTGISAPTRMKRGPSSGSTETLTVKAGPATKD